MISVGGDHEDGFEGVVAETVVPGWDVEVSEAFGNFFAVFLFPESFAFNTLAEEVGLDFFVDELFLFEFVVEELPDVVSGVDEDEAVLRVDELTATAAINTDTRESLVGYGRFAL
jgi:hypothetical protein